MLQTKGEVTAALHELEAAEAMPAQLAAQNPADRNIAADWIGTRVRVADALAGGNDLEKPLRPLREISQRIDEELRARFSRALRRVAEWCREHRHEPLLAQQQALARKLRGHFAFYGITGNKDALDRFRYEVRGIWFHWLRRRGRRRMTWLSFVRVLDRFPLPNAIAVHSVLRLAKP